MRYTQTLCRWKYAGSRDLRIRNLNKTKRQKKKNDGISGGHVNKLVKVQFCQRKITTDKNVRLYLSEKFSDNFNSVTLHRRKQNGEIKVGPYKMASTNPQETEEGKNGKGVKFISLFTTVWYSNTVRTSEPVLSWPRSFSSARKSRVFQMTKNSPFLLDYLLYLPNNTEQSIVRRVLRFELKISPISNTQMWIFSMKPFSSTYLWLMLKFAKELSQEFTERFPSLLLFASVVEPSFTGGFRMKFRRCFDGYEYNWLAFTTFIRIIRWNKEWSGLLQRRRRENKNDGRVFRANSDSMEDRWWVHVRSCRRYRPASGLQVSLFSR